MSAANANSVLSLQEDDLTKILVANAHLGAQNLDHQMAAYVYKRKNNGVCLFNVRKMWDKLVFAARAIAAIENPADVCVISARQIGQRACLKFARYTGATPIAGRFTPGSFTNQIQRAYKEPRLVVVLDPVADHQPITEASYVNIPVIAFSNSDNPCRYVDLAIPCNNRGTSSIGLMVWFLAREVLRIRGTLSRTEPWDVMCDLFFYRDQEEAAKEELPAATEGHEQYEQEPGGGPPGDEWNNQDNTTIGQGVTLQAGVGQDQDWAAGDDWAAQNRPTTVEGWNQQPSNLQWTS